MSISVIIPCYNAEEYIEECIHSCLRQSQPPTEIICVNNNSTDKTLDLLNQLASDHNIKVYSETKKGACAARNKGLREASGEYIQFLDADDLLLEYKLEQQTKLLDEGHDIIIGAYTYQYFDGRKKTVQPLQDHWKGLFTTQLGITSANLWKKSILDKVNGWNEHLMSSQEYALLFECIKEGANLKIDDRRQTIIRQQEAGNISQTNVGAGTLRYLELRKAIYNYLEQEEPVYMEKERTFFNQRLFDVIRRLYPHNPQKSITEFNELLGNSFKPEVSGSNSQNYVTLYKVLGFKNTEKLKSIFSGK